MRSYFKKQFVLLNWKYNRYQKTKKQKNKKQKKEKKKLITQELEIFDRSTSQLEQQTVKFAQNLNINSKNWKKERETYTI